jgi:hypothetical protein
MVVNGRREREAMREAPERITRALQCGMSYPCLRARMYRKKVRPKCSAAPAPPSAAINSTGDGSGA